MVEVSSEWRWVDADGVESTVDEWELVSSLSSGALPHYTLVWRPGWAQWMPACRVAELAPAVGPKAERAIAPPIDPTLQRPPAPPLHRYRAFRARDLAGAGRAARGRPAVGHGGTSDPFDPPTLGRRPMPTLVDEQMPANVRATLRPPAAVPPPPRSMPRTASVVSPDATDVAALALGQRAAAVDAPAAAAPPVRGELSDALVNQSASVRQLPPVAPVGAPANVEPRSSSPAAPEYSEPRPGAVTATMGTPLGTEPANPEALVALPPRARLASIGRQSSRLMAAVVATAIAATLLAVAAVLLVVTSQPRAPLPQPAVASSTSAPLRARECLLERSARRIAPSIERSVGPELLILPDGKLALGYAESGTSGAGLLLTPASLAIQRIFEQQGAEPVLGVVPVLAGDKPVFEVDRRGGPLSNARTVARGLQIGRSSAGIARVTRPGGEPELIWAAADEDITIPRSAEWGGGYAVTFRRGGQNGTVMVGWLDRAGKSASELRGVAFDGFVGTPGIAANEHEILVSVASRPDADAKWGVALARAAGRALPTRGQSFPIPPGGPGVETISPSATGLSNGRWLLQWTEGATGNRQVRVQTLGPDLSPIGAPITLSAVEDNAGQGVIQAVGTRAVSLFIVIKGDTRQLWAAALTCP